MAIDTVLVIFPRCTPGKTNSKEKKRVSRKRTRSSTGEARRTEKAIQIAKKTPRTEPRTCEDMEWCLP